MSELDMYRAAKDALAAAPQGGVVMSLWGARYTGPGEPPPHRFAAERPHTIVERQVLTVCGTACCVGGWMVLQGRIPDHEAVWHPTLDGTEYLGVIDRDTREHVTFPWACAHGFRITTRMAERLLNRVDDSPAEIAAFIDAMIARLEAKAREPDPLALELGLVGNG